MAIKGRKKYCCNCSCACKDEVNTTYPSVRQTTHGVYICYNATTNLLITERGGVVDKSNSERWPLYHGVVEFENK